MHAPSAPRIILTIVATVLLLTGCNRIKSIAQGSDSGQSPPQTFADAQTAAAQSLVTFRQLVNSQNFKDLGFESTDEVANAALGEPIKILVVSLNQLVRYEAGSDPTKLLIDFNQVHYPVTVQEQVRSGILIDQTNGKWKAGTFGASNLAKLIAAARKASAASSTDSVVQVPALGLSFLAHTQDGKMTLAPLSDNPDFQFNAGRAMPAEEVFALLAPAAKGLQTDAPM